MFAHLHVHSQYSVLDGQASIDAIVDKAMADGMPGIALTDHGNMFGVKEFFNYVNKKNSKIDDPSKRFKPILGCEVYVTNAPEGLTSRNKDEKRHHLILLAKNLKGYHNLVKIVSRAWQEGYYYHPRTDHADIAAHAEGLICCSACIGGEVPRLITAWHNAVSDGNATAAKEYLQRAEEAIVWFKNLFGDDYYLEIQRHKATIPNANHDTYPMQEVVNDKLLHFAQKHGIKVVATNDVHFVNESDAEAHERLLCVSTGKRMAEDHLLYTKQEWLKTTAEMGAVFSDVPQALENTLEVLGKVEFYDIDHAPIMPFFAIPPEFGTEEEYRSRITHEDLFNEFTRDENSNVIMSAEEAEKKISKLGGYDKLYRIKFEADYLAKLAYEGAERRYGSPLPAEISERIKFELHIMKTMGFPGYFLIVQDFINESRRTLGVSVGPGRGSAAGSCVAYCLGITQIDPVKYDLLFERFLNPDRISLPDIDVDFDDDGRARVLKYVTDKYGADNVAHIITYGTMAAKSALKDVARVEGLPIPESDRLTKLIPAHMPEVNGKELKPTLKNCYEYLPDFQAELTRPDPALHNTLMYARQLEGNVRNTGVHACGVIICRDPISDWVPVATADDKVEGKLLVTQYEGKVIEETGLIKMDFLGLKTLSIIMDACQNIKLTRGIDLDMEAIPIDDPKTYELYSRGQTIGTFQFESAGMQKYLRELQPSAFEDLIAMNALYRPGPMEYIPEFIDRKHGRKEIVYDIPVMERYLKDTYGITVYQEQVMLLSRLLANFTRGESDTLRKAMGKKLIDKMNHLKGKFLEGGQANGHDPAVLEKIWKDWEKFASYAFNKSHATCYSWVAYQTAYLKANYPAEFMAAVLSRNRNDITKLTNFMDECKAMKIRIKGPDVNESFVNFGVNAQGDIRFGLAAIKGVGENVVDAIIKARKEGGRFESPYDFVERVPSRIINRRVLEALVLAGAFDWYADIKREDYFEPNARGETFSELLMRYGQQFQQQADQASNSLFGDMQAELNTAGRPEVRPATPWVDAVKLEKERELVGMYLSAHPLDPYYMELNYGLQSVKDYLNAPVEEGREIIFGGMVTKFIERPTRTGGNFAIITLEDYSGSTEIRLFGQKYIDFAKYGREGTPIAVTVKAQRRFPTYGRTPDDTRNPVQYEVARIQLLNDIKGTLISGVTISLSRDDLTGQFVDLLNEQIADPAANGQLSLRVFDPESNRTIRLTSSKKVPLGRRLVNTLDSLDLTYTFDKHSHQ